MQLVFRFIHIIIHRMYRYSTRIKKVDKIPLVSRRTTLKLLCIHFPLQILSYTHNFYASLSFEGKLTFFIKRQFSTRVFYTGFIVIELKMYAKVVLNLFYNGKNENTAIITYKHIATSLYFFFKSIFEFSLVKELRQLAFSSVYFFSFLARRKNKLNTLAISVISVAWWSL